MTMPPMGSLNYIQRKRNIDRINQDNIHLLVKLKLTLESVKIRSDLPTIILNGRLTQSKLKNTS